VSSKALIYHPLRWYHLRSEPDVTDLYADFDSSKEDLLTNKMTEEEIASEMGNAYYGVPGMCFEEIEDIIGNQEDVWDDIAEFEEAGSNIFHLRPALVEMFKNSSASEVPMDAIKLPFDCIYLYWGPDAGMTTPDGGAVVDGAYVRVGPADVCGFFYGLTTAIPQIQDVMKEPLMKRLSLDKYRFSCLIDDFPISIGQMFENRFSSYHTRQTEQEYYEHEKAMNDVLWENKSPIAVREIPPYEDAIANFKPEPEDVLWREQEEKALNLIVNALCYLSYDKKDVEHRYPKEAPSKLVVQAENTRKPSEARRGKSKLEALGFRKVYVCGDNVQKKMKDSVHEGGVSTHWRRGHWRNQAHGEHRAKHKLIWIEPVLIKPGECVPAGHIYVSGDGSKPAVKRQDKTR
jgi:hypothetical protein